MMSMLMLLMAMQRMETPRRSDDLSPPAFPESPAQTLGAECEMQCRQERKRVMEGCPCQALKTNDD
jgi:hypothetical protein